MKIQRVTTALIIKYLRARFDYKNSGKMRVNRV